MPVSVSAKLRIKPNMRLLTLHAPAYFRKCLAQLPAGVSISDKAKEYDQVHWFVADRAQLEKDMSKVMKLVRPGIIVWVYYPKGSSKIQTDLTRDRGWDCLLAEGDKLTWINLVSFDDTWSVFGFRAKSESDRVKEQKPKEREIFNWIDPGTKKLRLPEDLKAALYRKKKESAFFESLSFSNKKEYVEWIVTAKKPETRIRRIADTMERLGRGWKNPAHRE